MRIIAAPKHHRDPMLRVWVQCLRHDKPPADLSQAEDAIKERRNNLLRFIAQGDTESLKPCPEWQVELNLLGLPADMSVPDVLQRLPETIKKPEKRASPKQKREYSLWQEKWYQPYGGAYRNLCRRVTIHAGRVFTERVILQFEDSATA